MRTQEQVLKQFDEWATGNALVRAAILTGTRADPERKTDFLSDYDIELYVADLGPFREDDVWLDPFGPVMVRWPFKPRSTGKDGWVTRLVLFKDGVRIDFQITGQTMIPSNAYDDDYEVLIDKDNLTARLDGPTHTEHLVKKPSREEYDTLVHEFWWDATYVPKYLWRDELPFAASMLGQAIRDEYLQTIIEWFIGLQNEWSVNTGVRGRNFKHYLDDETWSEYESTFARADVQEHWQAFFNALALFRKLARIVGETLGYEYPARLDREMTDYYSQIRDAEKKTANKSDAGAAEG
ncbi:MAG: aminoglycoside 6-adenylyltransferase [Candidatus Hydrogenedentes bacterium]|nr:aminoglycoside 6-adenylyltransferase [Candidatus Hydrogenedentota bacterium]